MHRDLFGPLVLAGLLALWGLTHCAPPVAAEVGQPPTPDARYELALPLVSGAPASVFPHCPYTLVEGGYQCLLPLVPVALTPEPPP